MKLLLSIFATANIGSASAIQIVNENTVLNENYAKNYDYLIKKDELIVSREGSNGDQSKSSNGKALKNLSENNSVTYNRLFDEEWSMYARGAFFQHTRKTDRVNDMLVMKVVDMNSDEIKLHYRDELEDTEGWAKQKSWIEINLTIKADVTMEYTNYVYAGSWGAVSMAMTISSLTGFILLI